jgi:AraC family transcriptional regulator
MRRPAATRRVSSARKSFRNVWRHGAAVTILGVMETPIHDPLAAALARKKLAGTAGGFLDRPVARGDGWYANDFVCTCGPDDHDAEERPTTSGVALLLSGSFVVRDRHGTSLLSEGSMFLVEAGQCFVCSHRHGAGDRCLSFQFEPKVFERVAHDAGARPAFAHNRLPPLRALSGVAARARSAMQDPQAVEEIAYALAGTALRLAGRSRGKEATAHHHGRMTEVLRYMAEHSAAPHKLNGLARLARMSPYHFLRSFKATTGVTPHQWLLRARLRNAAEQLATTRLPITDVALDVGFADLSNFTRSFHAEFGASPRQYRLVA